MTEDQGDRHTRSLGQDESYIAPEHMEKFSWRPGDVEITDGDWMVSFDGPPGSGSTYLAQDLDGLVQHLTQQPGYDGELQAALSRFAATDLIRHAPMRLIGEIMLNSSPGLREPLARTFAKAHSSGDGTARHGYGIPVFQRDRYSCAYCGLDMLTSYNAWLQLSVDHVIPHQMVKRHEYRQDWIENLANFVTCCRACNELGNRFQFDDPAPTSEDAFLDLRDRVFVQRRARLALAHARERAIYDKQRQSVAPVLGEEAIHSASGQTRSEGE